MHRPPRRPTVQLFDRAVLQRGLIQGGGLLALLSGLYMCLQSAGDVARTAVFVTLVLANLGLIFSNRHWQARTWQARAVRNRYFGWGSLVAIALLALVLGIAPLRGVFAFVPLDLTTALLCTLTAAAGVAWFELAKFAAGTRAS